MNISVVGPGALGCLFAAKLARSGNTVWLFDHDVKRASYIADKGIILEVGGKDVCVPVRSTVDPKGIGITDLVLLCVKSQDVETALQHLKPHLSNEILLIALQNGIGHHEMLHRAAQFYAVGITAQGGTLAGMGRVVHGGSGQTVLGHLPTASAQNVPLLKRVAKVFTAAGIQTTVSEEISGAIWDKLIVNVGINALTAIHNCRNGELLNDRSLLAEQKAAVEEAIAVAIAKGIRLSGDPIENTVKVCLATSQNVSSMLQDVRKGRRTEIDAINGAIVREGRRLGIPMPVNSELVNKVKALERA